MKVGDSVRCINVGSSMYLVEGETYKIRGIENGQFLIDPFGLDCNEYYYDSNYFEALIDYVPFKLQLP